ncbi:hypothetical protein AAHC03_013944 [Spirometra sp. Aus1]
MGRLTTAVCITLLLLTVTRAEPPLGVVLWHGMGDTGKSSAIVRLSNIIKEEIPGIYVLDLVIGGSSLIDRLNTYFMPINTQLARACKIVHSDKNLSQGFHLIGFSQGGLFVRALVQRCPPAKVGSVISIGGPQEGVFGLPSCPETSTLIFCNTIRSILTRVAYVDFIQSRLAQAQYWHDPLREDVYREKSRFLAEINQEGKINQDYRENMLKVRNLVLVRFMDDTTVVPGESQWFGFYKRGQSTKKYNITENAKYENDTLGLKSLDEKGRLHLLPLPGDHLQFTDSWFRHIIVRKFLSPDKSTK